MPAFTPFSRSRDRTGHEIYVLLDDGGKLFLVEIKSGQTVYSGMFDSLNWWSSLSGQAPDSATLVYGGSAYHAQKGITIRPWFGRHNR
jgi:hypothetical protein